MPGFQVRVQTSEGLRMTDITETSPDGSHAFEVKVNGSPYLPLQSEKEYLISGGNGTSAGHLNSDFPHGSATPAMPTTVERVQCRSVPVAC